jgi:hypothetical protein
MPGLLGQRPNQAFAAFASPQFGRYQFAAPPSVYQAPGYGAPPPMPSQQMLIPGPGQAGQAFGQNPPPFYHGPPPFQPPQQYPEPMSQPGSSSHGPSFEQMALIGALQNPSMQGNPGQWIADSGASTHLSANLGILSQPRSVFHAPVIVGNGSHLPITHLGQSAIPSSSRLFIFITFS